MPVFIDNLEELPDGSTRLAMTPAERAAIADNTASLGQEITDRQDADAGKANLNGGNEFNGEQTFNNLVNVQRLDVGGELDAHDQIVVFGSDGAAGYIRAGSAGDSEIPDAMYMSSPSGIFIDDLHAPQLDDLSAAVADAVDYAASVETYATNAVNAEATARGAADTAIVATVGGKMAKSANLSDVASAAQSLLNLGGAKTDGGNTFSGAQVFGGSATFGGRSNFGNGTNAWYIENNGDVRVTAGQISFKNAGGSNVLNIVSDTGRAKTPNGLDCYGGGIGSGDNQPLYLTAYGMKPVVVADTSTSVTGDKIELARPTVFRSTAQLASINTTTTPGTAVGQLCYSSVTSKASEWDGSTWQPLR